MTTPEEMEDLSDFGLYDEANPRSLVNIVPPAVKDAIINLDKKYFLLDETQLKKQAKPSPTLNYLRLNFWLEYNRAQDARKPMLVKNITRGVSSPDYLLHVVLEKPLFLTWMLTPPTDYSLVQMDILSSGLDKLRRAVSMPLYIVKEDFNDEGKVIRRTKRPNIQAIAEVRKIVGMLSDRVQGAVVQKLAIKQHTTNGNQQGQLPSQYDPGALDDLNKTLAGLGRRLELAAGSTETVEEFPKASQPMEADPVPSATEASGVETVDGVYEDGYTPDLGDQTEDGILA